MQSLRRRHFRDAGSAFLLTMAALVGIVFVLVIAFTFYGIFFAQRRLGERAEVATLTGSRCLNIGDRAGQINNILAASRQLMFDSRQTYDDMAAHHPEVLPLAKHLLDESRQGAALVISERQRVLSFTLADVRDWAKATGGHGQRSEFVLPWARTADLSLDGLDVGYVKGIDSNVKAPLGNPGLLAIDQKYIDPTANLYYGNVSLSLPAPDSDLIFKISSLPAPVNGTVAPARLLGNELFMPTKSLIKSGQTEIGSCDHLPSALRLTARVTFQSSLGAKTAQAIVVSTTATTNGASPMP